MENDLKLIIMPRYDLEEAHTKFKCEYVISILEYEERNAVPCVVSTPEGIDPKHHQKVYFSDTKDTKISGSPSRQDIETILNFYDDIIGKPTFLHCYAGISRSSASVYALYCRHLGKGCEVEALRLTCASAPYKGIWPNDLIVAHADDILGRDGAMIKALADWKASEKTKLTCDVF